VCVSSCLRYFLRFTLNAVSKRFVSIKVSIILRFFLISRYQNFNQTLKDQQNLKKKYPHEEYHQHFLEYIVLYKQRFERTAFQSSILLCLFGRGCSHNGRVSFPPPLFFVLYFFLILFLFIFEKKKYIEKKTGSDNKSYEHPAAL
jgi:hypothetical protein